MNDLQAKFFKTHVESNPVLSRLYRKNGIGTPAIQKPFRSYIANIYLPQYRDLETWSAGIKKRRLNVTEQEAEKPVDKSSAAINACHFCDNTGYIELKFRDGTKKRMNCMHPAEEKVFNHVRKIDALIVSADPGYKGHRENEMSQKTTLELQQEFVQALQKFGQNNCFGGER
ncbi:hypothetical protein PN36_13635 [Candidatus Thiomargarita nelsonii]|uniref:Uncharacterized protein n=1 Tax=Candidatus Thiomargarita nelsonii TaxID=1003181 RepID=A0A4E0R2E3_9GAMM|nr:hypothetical protein PN36_13635 [Candidatus Thiomargarita nelsonii]